MFKTIKQGLPHTNGGYTVEMIREAMSTVTPDCSKEAAEWEADETELARLCGLR